MVLSSVRCPIGMHLMMLISIVSNYGAHSRWPQILGRRAQITRPKPTAPPIQAPNPPSLPQYSYLPTTSPSAHPSAKPTVRLTARLSRRPSLKPTAGPSVRPSSKPTARPSLKPTAGPTSRPSVRPSSKPTARPSLKPTAGPTSRPSVRPSSKPTARPSLKPTAGPTSRPSVRPSSKPTARPSLKPTAGPTSRPSVRPSSKPTARPSLKPTAGPTSRPSVRPSSKPTARPSLKPTAGPTSRPSVRPSSKPTARPSLKPTAGPTSRPSVRPSSKPTARPSLKPTAGPTSRPSVRPSSKPTARPSLKPTAGPTSRPSVRPSSKPTARPSLKPTAGPTSRPSVRPSSKPMALVTAGPTSLLTVLPSTFRPSVYPSIRPTGKICVLTPEGDFGNVTDPTTKLYVDFKYELEANNTILGNRTISDVINNVELAVTDMLLKTLFSNSCSSYSVQSVDGRRKILLDRSLVTTSNQLLGISKKPDDVISYGEECSQSIELPSDATCSVVNSRLTLYSVGASTQLIVQAVLDYIQSNMNKSSLNNADAAIIQLTYKNESDADKDVYPVPISSNPSPSQQTLLPAVLGSFLGLGLLLVLFVALRRYASRKDERELLEADNGSNFSLSGIWDDKAMDGLEIASSYDEFKVSQAVLRSNSPIESSQQLLHQQNGLVSIAEQSAATGTVLRITNNYGDLDPDDSIETNSWSNDGKDTSILGIQKSPEAERGLADNLFSALAFSPLQFHTVESGNEPVKMSKRLATGEIGSHDVLLLNSGSYLSDMDDSSA